MRGARRIAAQVIPRAMTGVALVLGLTLSASALAQMQRSFLNPSFETPALTASNAANGCYRLLDSALVPGWSTRLTMGRWKVSHRSTKRSILIEAARVSAPPMTMGLLIITPTA